MARYINDGSVFLTSTDTTIGFVSQNENRLTEIKKRPPYKHYIIALPSLKELKKMARIPQKHKNKVRRAKKSTFILPNGHSYRIIHDNHHHHDLISSLGWAYTTSANLSSRPYDESWARSVADIVIEPLIEKDNFPSRIYKINNKTIQTIR